MVNAKVAAFRMTVVNVDGASEYNFFCNLKFDECTGTLTFVSVYVVL